MRFLFPFLASFFSGYLLIDLICRKDKKMDFFLHCFLAAGLGLGFSGIIIFLLFFFTGKADARAAIYVNLIFLFLLLLFDRKNIGQSVNSLTERTAGWPQPEIWFLSIILLMWGVYKMALWQKPYGGWDGWALYNMKARFLFWGGPAWKNIFQLHWHTQPDYPLLLSLINTWGWIGEGTDAFHVPAFTAAFFMVICCGLLFSGIKRYFNTGLAVFSALLLLTVPSYLIHGASQYADIVLAYYLLASLITLVITVREERKDFALLSGLFMGFMTFTKNEGILMLLLLVFLTTGYLFRKVEMKEEPHTLGRGAPFLKKEEMPKTRSKIILFLFCGTSLGLLSTGILKLLLAPPHHGAFGITLEMLSGFLNFNKLETILKSFISGFRHGGHIWVFILALLIAGYREIFHKETKILTIFLGLYFLSIVAVYLTTANYDLQWRLAQSINRILFYLLPSALFLAFYVYGKEEERLKKDE